MQATNMDPAYLRAREAFLPANPPDKAPPVKDDRTAKTMLEGDGAKPPQDLQERAKGTIDARLDSDDGRKAFGTALDGRTEGERTVAEQKTIDRTLKAIKDGKVPDPNFVYADTASKQDIRSGQAPANALPPGVTGAFVRGQGDKPGTALIAEGATREQQTEAVLEEQSEAIAAFAKRQGVTVAQGDVGNRLRLAANGDQVGREVTPELYRDAPTDKALVMLDGEQVLARAASPSEEVNPDSKPQETAPNVKTDEVLLRELDTEVSQAEASARALRISANSSANPQVQLDNVRKTTSAMIDNFTVFSKDLGDIGDVFDGEDIERLKGSKFAEIRERIKGINEIASSHMKGNMGDIADQAIRSSVNIRENVVANEGLLATRLGLVMFGVAAIASGPFTAAGGSSALGVVGFWKDATAEPSISIENVAEDLGISDDKLRTFVESPYHLGKYRSLFDGQVNGDMGSASYESMIEGTKKLSSRVFYEQSSAEAMLDMGVNKWMGEENYQKLLRAGWRAKYEAKMRNSGDGPLLFEQFNVSNPNASKTLTKTPEGIFTDSWRYKGFSEGTLGRLAEHYAEVFRNGDEWADWAWRPYE